MTPTEEDDEEEDLDFDLFDDQITAHDTEEGSIRMQSVSSGDMGPEQSTHSQPMFDVVVPIIPSTLDSENDEPDQQLDTSSSHSRVASLSHGNGEEPPNVPEVPAHASSTEVASADISSAGPSVENSTEVVQLSKRIQSLIESIKQEDEERRTVALVAGDEMDHEKHLAALELFLRINDTVDLFPDGMSAPPFFPIVDDTEFEQERELKRRAERGIWTKKDEKRKKNLVRIAEKEMVRYLSYLISMLFIDQYALVQSVRRGGLPNAVMTARNLFAGKRFLLVVRGLRKIAGRRDGFLPILKEVIADAEGSFLVVTTADRDLIGKWGREG